MYGPMNVKSNEKTHLDNDWSYSLIVTYKTIKKPEVYYFSLSGFGKQKKKSAWILHTYDTCFSIFWITKSHLLKYPQFFLITFLNAYYIIVLFYFLILSC
jgi:predicted 3-demethylubiquinone-9 3-methyltransferase (glyoxalase superfamily)